MTSYFVDAWYFIARIDSTDAHHARARRIDARYIGANLMTHDAVLAEALAFFSGFGSGARMKAAAAVRSAIGVMKVVTPNRELFHRALDLYESRPDKAYSLVDCMSMELMKQRDITHVLTNDHHFLQEGFTVVNE